MAPYYFATVIQVCVALVVTASLAHAHMAIMNPKARQVVNGVGLIQYSYTTMGSFGDVYGNNANVFGGPSGPEQLRLYGYDVCGDDGRRKAFQLPTNSGYAPTQPQMTIVAGSTFEIMVRITAHHWGWFEFRLCAPSPGKSVVTEESAACFKQNLIQLAPEQYYTAADMQTGVRSVFDFEGTPEAGYNFHHAKCQQGPPDTCCDPNSGCSPETSNVHRFMLPKPGVDNNDFRIRLLAPNVTCDRCTLQVLYRTGNSPDSFPETFWNCADVALAPRGTVSSTSSPNSSSLRPTGRPTDAVVTSTNRPSSTQRPTPKQPSALPPTQRPVASPPTTRFPTKRPTKRPTGFPTRAGAPTIRTTTRSPVAPTSACSATWSQCGGIGYTGPTCCASVNDFCAYENDWWSMCKPKN